MANYATLKSAIQDVIKQNGNNEITGEILQQSLLAMVNSLGAGYQFAGIAKLTPTQTDPGTPDQNVFYIAAEPGTYTNFPISGGYLQVAENEVAIFKYNGQWSKETTGAATAAAVSQLGQYVENPEWLKVITDSDKKVIEGIQSDGTKTIFVPIETQAERQESVNNPEWIKAVIDFEGKLLGGIRRDGKVVAFLPILLDKVSAQNIQTSELEISEESGRTALKESLQQYDTNLFTAFDNLVCIGDSLTFSSVPIDMESSEHTYRQAFVPYPKVVSRLSGNIDFQILAVGGFTAKDCWDRFKDDIVSKTNPIAVVFLGSNGGLTDTLDTDVSGDDPDAWANNNIGCYCRIVNKLKTLGYKIILLRGWRSTTVSVQQTKSAINHVAERFGCACMDAPYTSEPAYHKAIEAGYDYLHSNDLGYSWFAIKLIENLGYLSASQKELLISNI